MGGKETRAATVEKKPRRVEMVNKNDERWELFEKRKRIK